MDVPSRWRRLAKQKAVSKQKLDGLTLNLIGFLRLG